MTRFDSDILYDLWEGIVFFRFFVPQVSDQSNVICTYGSILKHSIPVD